MYVAVYVFKYTVLVKMSNKSVYKHYFSNDLLRIKHKTYSSRF